LIAGIAVMARHGLQCAAGLIFLLVVIGGVFGARAQDSDELANLRAQVRQLHGQGKYADALAVQRVVTANTEKAEKVAAGNPGKGTASALGALAGYALFAREFDEALAASERGLAIAPELLWIEVNRAHALLFIGRLDEARAIYFAHKGKRFSGSTTWEDRVADNFAALQKAGIEHAAFEEIATALGVNRTAPGRELRTLNQQIRQLVAAGKHDDAFPLADRYVALARQAHGEEHSEFANALGWLGVIYRAQRRYAEAEPLLQRALAVRERADGPDHPAVRGGLSALAGVYRAQSRFAEAEPLYKRALAIAEKRDPHHPDVANNLNDLAGLCRAQGRLAEAEQLYKRAVAIAEKGLGPDHSSVGTALNDLASLYVAQGRFAEAEPLHQRTLKIYQTVLGPDHPWVGTSLSNLADLYFAQGDWIRAADYFRRSTGVTIRRAEFGTDDVGQNLTGKRRAEAEHLGYRFWTLVKTVYRLAQEGRNAEATLLREMFQMAQWARGLEAAASLAQMAARGAKGDVQLTQLARERQDLVAEWQARDGERTAAVAEAPSKRDKEAEAANVTRLAAIDARIADIDKRLAADFPDYTALSRPRPASVEEVQSELGAHEALVFFLDTPERKPAPQETFVWVVTKTDVRWVRSTFGAQALRRDVAALRCGLDRAAWYGNGLLRCTKALGIEIANAPGENDPLPFDHARAHALYKALFGEVEDLIAGKHLLIVPSGPLTQLPFQVLVTALPPKAEEKQANKQAILTTHRAVAWLARRHALTVLPAISSLKALRRVAKPSAARKPMIGFGNPLLDGDQGDAQYGDYYKRQAQRARDRQRCAETPDQRVASNQDVRPGAAPVVTRGGFADLADLKAQTPLPDTADELCAVARDLDGTAADIRLGAHATEREVKALSDSGALAQYRILHFATHGALRGRAGYET
jgi:tetratricopeptide (TPR) repeat protein